MKKTLLAVLALFIGASTFASASVLEDAILRGYDQGLTKYSTTFSFRPYDTLRRDEAAKFFVQFAEIEGYNTTQNSSSCSFSDEKWIIQDLKSYVVDACRYNIIRGINGKYLPDQKLTNAQAVTIIVRILAGNQSEANVAHWADNYYKKAKEIGLDLSKFSVKDNPTTRGNVMMLMHDASNGGTNQNWQSSGDKEIDKILQSLTDILDGK